MSIQELKLKFRKQLMQVRSGCLLTPITKDDFNEIRSALLARHPHNSYPSKPACSNCVYNLLMALYNEKV